MMLVDKMEKRMQMKTNGRMFDRKLCTALAPACFNVIVEGVRGLAAVSALHVALIPSMHHVLQVKRVSSFRL